MSATVTRSACAVKIKVVSSELFFPHSVKLLNNVKVEPLASVREALDFPLKLQLDETKSRGVIAGL